MQQHYDRAAEDRGNVVELGHVNLSVPEHRAATLFYVMGLGLTRDPYLVVGVDNMWVNAGVSQFHLPIGDAQVLDGTIGLVIPDRAALLRRLAEVKPRLAGTRFAYREGNDFVEAICPWGNVFHCHETVDGFGPAPIGMPYVEFKIGTGKAEGVARFYRELFDAPAILSDGGKVALVSAGIGQTLAFRETDQPPARQDAYHIQIYAADFSSPYTRLLERNLITEESSQHQYRFNDIVDPASGEALFRLEHEVRSTRHPLYGRPLVNRNPVQTNTEYVPGRDALPA